MTPNEARRAITKYRGLCLIHRYLYYVKNEPILSDLDYDMLERKLIPLVIGFPAAAHQANYALDCPTQNPGSSNADDYPRRIEQLAESLLQYHKEQECK